MKRRTIIGVISVLLMLSIGGVFQLESYPLANSQSDNDYNVDTTESEKNVNNAYNLAESHDTLEGVIDPAVVEQAGYYASDNTTGRTDTGENIIQDLLIDEENGWLGSEAEVDIYSLERLYAVNGSLDDGIGGTNQNPTGSATYYPYGWDATSSAGVNGDDQFAAYEKQSDPYVTVVNQALEGGFFSDYYDHFTDSYVVWSQTVQNAPYKTDFVLSFDYLYFSGIIYNQGGVNPNGDAWLIVAIDGVIEWNMSLLSLSTRNVWNNTGEINLNLPSVGSSFTFAIGIYIQDGMRLYADDDYDNDGIGDGVGNVASFIVHLDDISFVGQSPPTFESVQLEFKAGSFVTSITGSNGEGSATISNPSLWTTNPLQVEIMSNTSIRVLYRARLLSHRFINSSWTTDISREGVSFTTTSNASPEMTAFAYVGIVDPYEDFYVNIIHPQDWENATIFDPFLNDVTVGTISNQGILTIPTQTLDLLGWWKIVFQAPNYINQAEVEIFDNDIWTTTSILKVQNTTRASVTIGTIDNNPPLTNPVNVTWFLPNETIWAEEQITNASGNTGVSASLNLGALNTTAGQWLVSFAWTNGTEIAFGSTKFDFYRIAQLSALNNPLETEFGSTISNFLHYQDEFTGEYLLEDSASLSANWSSTTINFVPNLVRNWWEADFDTTLLEGGRFVVVVNASRPFYEDISTSFEVLITYQTEIEVISFSGQSIEVLPNSSFEVRFNYTRIDGSGITGAEVGVSYSSVDGILIWSSWIDFGNGTYSLTLRAVYAATYTLSISAEKEFHYNSSTSVTVISNEIPTDVVLTDSSASISIYQAFELQILFKDDEGTGIPGASIQISNLPDDIMPSAVTDFGNGYYNISLTGNAVGAFDLLFQASKTNYQNSTAAFSLLVTLIPTELNIEGGITSLALDYSEPFEIILFYERTDISQNITSADFTILPSASIGLQYIVNDYGDYFGIVLKGYQIGSWQLVVSANKTDYRLATASILLEVEEIETQLSILNIGDLPVERGLNESFDLIFEYTQLNGTGIDAGIADVSYTSSVLGLAWDSLTDFGNGTYSLQILINSTSTYSITISAAKQFFASAFDSVLVVVERIPTQIVSLNGTTDSIAFGESYNLAFRYTNNSGYGLSGASVLAISIEPETGLVLHTILDQNDGQYSVILIPSAAKVFTLIVEANLTNYEPQFLTFTLSVNVVPTTLQIEESSIETAIDQSVTVFLVLEDEEMDGLSGALIEIVNVPSDLSISAFTDYGNGSYSVDIAPNLIQSYDLLFRASLENYQTSTEAFSLLVTEIPTNLRIIDEITSLSLDYGEYYDIELSYTRTDLNQNITDAEINVISQGLNFSVIEAEGFYRIRIIGYLLGRWQLSITANRTDYRIASEDIFVDIESIDTVLEGSSPVGDLIYGKSYQFNFSYLFDSNQSYVQGSEIALFGDAQDWVTIVPLPSGEYEVSLVPQGLGIHSVTIEFDKEGHESKSFKLTFTVVEVPLEIIFEEGFNGVEGSTTQLVIRIVDEITEEPVSGLSPVYRIVDSQGIQGDSVALQEIDNGRYAADITIPDSGEVYSIRISLQDFAYEISTEGTTELIPDTDISRLFVRTAYNLSPVLVLVGAVIAGVIARTVTRRKQMKLNQQAQEIKKRFDDARNILGLIVIHRDSGVPVYSRMLRGGIEEGMVSAFITAIRNFRNEFAIEGGAQEGKIFPISDIIRVVSTKNLILAFVTIDAPSLEQRKKMLELAKTIGEEYDQGYSDTPMAVMDAETKEIFDMLFENGLDVRLLRRYRFTEGTPLPDDTKCVEEGAAKFDGHEFLLEQLAESITECGFDENRAYMSIMDAVNKDLLDVTDQRIYTRSSNADFFVDEVENLLKSKGDSDPSDTR